MGRPFPDIQKPSSRRRASSKPQLKSEFENGYTQIRSKATRPKGSWELSWEHLPIAHWEDLKLHFNEVSGDSFIISKDMIYENEDKTVVYSIDEIKAESSNVIGHYGVEIKVEEL